MSMKYKAVLTAIFSLIFGAWVRLSPTVKVLCVMMTLDYISGVIASLYQGHKLSSKVGFRGLLRKAYQGIIVFMCFNLESLLGIQFLSEGIAMMLIANEGVSILENAVHMDIPVPSMLRELVEEMKGGSVNVR